MLYCLILGLIDYKNTDTAREKGYDGGKKVSGIKRHIAVDTQGVPHSIHITTANIGDRKGAEIMLEHAKSNLTAVQNIMGDGGYTGDNFANTVNEIFGVDVTVEIAKRNELHTFKVIPRRWVVERSFAWLDKNRRLWKNCERLINNSLQLVNLAFIAIILKRF